MYASVTLPPPGREAEQPLLDGAATTRSDSDETNLQSMSLGLKIRVVLCMLIVLVVTGSTFYYNPLTALYLAAFCAMAFITYGISMRDTSTSKSMLTSIITGGIAAAVAYLLAKSGGEHC